MIICYPSCKKCKHLLIQSIESIQKYNKSIEFYIFNNNEYSKTDLIEIRKYCSNLTVVDISVWMDIFDECLPLHNQTNCYIRLLMSRFFQLHRPEVTRFMYCDEDVLCCGDISKFYNMNFSSNVLGIIDISFDKSLNYINSGLLIIKTTLQLTDYLQALNMLKVLDITHHNDLPYIAYHDQYALNTVEHDCIIMTDVPHTDCPMKNMYYLVDGMLAKLNIAHTYGYKNDVNNEQLRNQFKEGNKGLIASIRERYDSCDVKGNPLFI